MIFVLFYGKKGFYTYTFTDFDLRRLPLHEPYQIFSPDGSYWYLDKNSGPVKSVNLQNETVSEQLKVDSVFIFKHYNILLCKAEDYSEPIIVCDCKNQRCHRYENESDAKRKIGLSRDLRFKHPKDVYQEFKQNPSRETLFNAMAK